MGSPEILIFAGEEVPRMALRVLQATHRNSEAQVAPTNQRSGLVFAILLPNAIETTWRKVGAQVKSADRYIYYLLA